MHHFKIIATWPEVWELVTNDFSMYEEEVCFMYKSNDDFPRVFLATANFNFVRILQERFKIVKCAIPGGLIKRGWNFIGNVSYFNK
jgi:hypothetical protein